MNTKIFNFGESRDQVIVTYSNEGPIPPTSRKHKIVSGYSWDFLKTIYTYLGILPWFIKNISGFVKTQKSLWNSLG